MPGVRPPHAVSSAVTRTRKPPAPPRAHVLNRTALRHACRLVAVVALLGAGVTSCSDTRAGLFPRSDFSARTHVAAAGPTALALGGRSFLTLPAGAAPAGDVLAATSASPPAGGWDRDTVPLRAPVHLTLSRGDLRRASLLSFAYNPALVPAGVSPAAIFGISTYQPGTNTWVPQTVKVDHQHHLIVAIIRHFSWWEPWRWDWGRISQDVLSVLGKRTSPPACASGSLPGYIQDVVTESDSDDPLYSCAENSDGQLEVKLVNNRNYGMVMTFGAPVSYAHHDNGGDTLQALVSPLIDRTLGRKQLYIPPLSGAEVVIPDTRFTVATFKAGPTRATLFADLAQIAFGGVNVAQLGGAYTKAAAACGQYFATNSLPTSEQGIVSLVESMSGCLTRTVIALSRSGALDRLTIDQLEHISGVLTFLDHATLAAATIGIATEIGDLGLGATVDRGLRQFTVYHAVKSPVTPPSTPTQTPTPNGLAVGDHFSDQCGIAWPTAPTYTSDSIEMTMSCEHVPEGEYLFTDVVYNDPNLQPTPDTGLMRVIGTIVGVAHSDYGFSILEVQASDVTFDSGGQ